MRSLRPQRVDTPRKTLKLDLFANQAVKDLEEKFWREFRSLRGLSRALVIDLLNLVVMFLNLKGRRGEI